MVGNPENEFYPLIVRSFDLTLDLDIFEFVGGGVRLGNDDVGVVLQAATVK